MTFLGPHSSLVAEPRPELTHALCTIKWTGTNAISMHPRGRAGSLDRANVPEDPSITHTHTHTHTHTQLLALQEGYFELCTRGHSPRETPRNVTRINPPRPISKPPWLCEEHNLVLAAHDCDWR
jgi:hypothetical protein